MKTLIDEVVSHLSTLEDEQKTLYFFDKICSIDEDQRMEFFKLLTNDPENVKKLFIMTFEDVIFLMYVFPKEERYDFINLLEKIPSLWKVFVRPETLVLFLEGLPEDNWADFFKIIPVYYEKEPFINYFLFSLFNDRQLKIISDNAQFTTMYNGIVTKIQNDTFTNHNLFLTWRKTLITINVLFHDNEKFLTYLKPLDEEIEQHFPAVSDSAPAERIYNYYFPSEKDFRTKDRKSYGRLIDDLFLKKERSNGLSHNDMPYFDGVISASVIEQFMKDYPRTTFKEIISSNQILLHGHNIHRLQWYVIQSAIEKGDIKLPEGTTIGDLFDVFMQVEFSTKKIWDTIIDRPLYYVPDSLQNPERLQSFLLTNPEVKKKLPHLNQYWETSYFKKIDRLYPNQQEAAKNYEDLVKSAVNEVFHVFFDERNPKPSFEQSALLATSDNEKRTVSTYPGGSGIFFKKSNLKENTNKEDRDNECKPE